MATESLPRWLSHELAEIQWISPWWYFSVDHPELGPAFEAELQKELNASHRLYPHRESARAVAKREDCDDVLFWLPELNRKVAIVHLTWPQSRELTATWPTTYMFDTLAEFVSKELTSIS